MLNFLSGSVWFTNAYVVWFICKLYMFRYFRWTILICVLQLKQVKRKRWRKSVVQKMEQIVHSFGSIFCDILYREILVTSFVPVKQQIVFIHTHFYQSEMTLTLSEY